LHRKNDLPAFIWSYGRKEWWIHGKLHRSTGPAIMCPNDKKEWWIHGQKIYRV
jgi:hypothetical protein